MNITPNSTLNPRSMLTLLVIGIAIIFAFSNSTSKNFDIKNVTVPEAKVLVDTGALVIDVRSEEAYKHRHIPGALLMPLSVLRAGIPASLAYAKDKPVVVYCSDGVTTGPEGTHLLNKAGYTKAVNIKSGIEGWAGAALPIQK